MSEPVGYFQTRGASRHRQSRALSLWNPKEAVTTSIYRGSILHKGAREQVVDGTSLTEKSVMCRLVVEEVEAGVCVQQQPERMALVQLPVCADRNWLTCEMNTAASSTIHE